MSTVFDKCLGVILHHEGGYVNHPLDPGGITNLGVTKKTYEAYVKRTVTKDEMKALTPATVAPLYKTMYWDALKCDDIAKIAPGLALCVFDFGVNAGVGRASEYLQNLVGVTADRKIGPNTLKAVRKFVDTRGHDGACEAYQNARRTYYRSLRTFRVFGRGWLRRVDSVEVTAKAMG